MIGLSWRAARRSTAGCAPAWADPKFLAQVTNPMAFVSAGKVLSSPERLSGCPSLHRAQIPRPHRYAAPATLRPPASLREALRAGLEIREQCRLGGARRAAPTPIFPSEFGRILEEPHRLGTIAY
jgi:hypothetical protein